MKTKTAIIIVIGVVVLLLGLRVLDRWVFVRQTETMFRYGKGYCKMKSPKWIIICEEWEKK